MARTPLDTAGDAGRVAYLSLRIAQAEGIRLFEGGTEAFDYFFHVEFGSGALHTARSEAGQPLAGRGCNMSAAVTWPDWGAVRLTPAVEAETQFRVVISRAPRRASPKHPRPPRRATSSGSAAGEAPPSLVGGRGSGSGSSDGFGIAPPAPPGTAAVEPIGVTQWLAMPPLLKDEYVSHRCEVVHPAAAAAAAAHAMASIASPPRTGTLLVQAWPATAAGVLQDNDATPALSLDATLDLLCLLTTIAAVFSWTSVVDSALFVAAVMVVATLPPLWGDLVLPALVVAAVLATGGGSAGTPSRPRIRAHWLTDPGGLVHRLVGIIRTCEGRPGSQRTALQSLTRLLGAWLAGALASGFATGAPPVPLAAPLWVKLACVVGYAGVAAVSWAAGFAVVPMSILLGMLAGPLALAWRLSKERCPWLPDAFDLTPAVLRERGDSDGGQVGDVPGGTAWAWGGRCYLLDVDVDVDAGAGVGFGPRTSAGGFTDESDGGAAFSPLTPSVHASPRASLISSPPSTSMYDGGAAFGRVSPSMSLSSWRRQTLGSPRGRSLSASQNHTHRQSFQPPRGSVGFYAGWDDSASGGLCFDDDGSIGGLASNGASPANARFFSPRSSLHSAAGMGVGGGAGIGMGNMNNGRSSSGGIPLPASTAVSSSASRVPWDRMPLYAVAVLPRSRGGSDGGGGGGGFAYGAASRNALTLLDEVIHAKLRGWTTGSAPVDAVAAPACALLQALVAEQMAMRAGAGAGGRSKPAAPTPTQTAGSGGGARVYYCVDDALRRAVAAHVTLNVGGSGSVRSSVSGSASGQSANGAAAVVGNGVGVKPDAADVAVAAGGVGGEGPRDADTLETSRYVPLGTSADITRTERAAAVAAVYGGERNGIDRGSFSSESTPPSRPLPHGANEVHAVIARTPRLCASARASTDAGSTEASTLQALAYVAAALFSPSIPVVCRVGGNHQDLAFVCQLTLEPTAARPPSLPESYRPAYPRHIVPQPLRRTLVACSAPTAPPVTLELLYDQLVNAGTQVRRRRGVMAFPEG